VIIASCERAGSLRQAQGKKAGPYDWNTKGRTERLSALAEAGPYD